MDGISGKKRQIETVLALYGDFLSDLARALGRTDYAKVRAAAFGVLDRALTPRELSAMLAMEGGLRDRFPGVRKRIRELLGAEIARALAEGED
ncbi:MAG: hypothetical protein IT344_05470 [Candidatus Dadabacteria bacterium]|nr:hypothetical protein [Candidatus Dadabacteria bacterium]